MLSIMAVAIAVLYHYSVAEFEQIAIFHDMRFTTVLQTCIWWICISFVAVPRLLYFAELQFGLFLGIFCAPFEV